MIGVRGADAGCRITGRFTDEKPAVFSQAALRQQIDELSRRLYWTQVALDRAQRLLQMLQAVDTRAEDRWNPCDPDASPRNLTLAEAKRRLVHEALDASKGNRRQAAKLMGISPASFYRLLARLGA